jgi:GNAT superfamily N-acetyltransferase
MTTPSYSVLYKLKDYKECLPFEREHPKQLRWDDKYKIFMLTQNENCQGIWMRDGKNGLIAEAIVTWQSDNVLHIDSFTVVPSYRGNGIGYQLIQHVIDWAQEMDYTHLIGEARIGASWHIFKNMTALPVLLYKNWSGTGEDYMSFKIEL